MTKLIAITIPILPGKTEQWRKFTNELKTTRQKDFNESRKKLNVYERTFFQSTPNGDMVIVTLEGENPQAAFQKFGQATDEFSKWFIKQVKEIHNLDLTQPMPKDSIPELIAESTPISITEPVTH